MHAFWFSYKKYPPFILGVFSILLGIIYLYVFSNEPLLKPDSLSYINFSPTRSIGYPFFLKSIHFLWGSYTAIPFIQISLFCAAGYFLSLSFFQISRSFFLSSCLLFSLLGNISFVKLSFYVLTDSLAQSILMICLALIIKSWDSKKDKYYYILCIVIGVSTLIRPLFIILSVLPFGLLLLRISSLTKDFFKKFIIGVFLLTLFISFGSMVQLLRYGFFKTEAFLGYNLIGKSLLAVPPNVHLEPLSKTKKEIIPVQYILEQAPSLHFRYLLSEPYYDEIRTLVVHETSISSISEQDTLWKNLSITYIKEHPKNYLKDFWMNYWALWKLWDLCTYQEQENFNKYIMTHSPLPILGTYREPEMRTAFNKKLGYPLIVYGIRSFLALGFLLSLGTTFLSIVYKLKKKRIPVYLGVGTLSALTIQSGFIAIACVQAGLGRYALSFWPCFCILFLSTTFIGFRRK